MTASAVSRRFCHILLATLAVLAGGAYCQAQSPGSSTPLSLPKLCMPVSYRQSTSTGPVTSKIAMLGDRYSGVMEVLSGWKEAGTPLVGHVGSRWEPVPCGDDIGLFYLVPLLAREKGWSAGKALDVFLQGVLFTSAVVGMAGLCLTRTRMWQRLLSVVPIVAVSYVAFKMGDVYVVQAAVVMMIVPWVIYGLKSGVPFWQCFSIAFSSGIVLGLAQWIRTQSGTPVLLFSVTLLWFSTLRRSLRIVLSLTLLIGMSLPLFYARLPLHERDKFLVLHQPDYQPPLNHHLVWHTLYLGLGYLTNPYVAGWHDTVAVDYVKNIDPSVIYGGEKYETLLQARVVEIAHQDHRFIFYTVAAKLGVLACMLLLCVNVGVVAAFAHPKPPGLELAFWMAMAFASLPGIFAVPMPQYTLGMIALAILYWYVSVGDSLERWLPEKRRSAPQS